MSTRLSSGRIRTGLVAGAALLALAGTVAGCSSEGEDGEPIEGAQSDSPEPTGESPGDDDENSADVAALEQLYQEYWDARIELENSEELDFSLYDGIATEMLVQQEGARLQPLREDGVYRRGEPTITDVTVEVTGDTARIEACKNEDGWQLLRNGEVLPDAVPDDLLKPHPYAMAAERSGDSWLISRRLPEEEATIACE
ncbi:hypothetical protein [Streptomyces sp. 6N223]|uniref:hypothetical protein n=1 Tax=Streptomyces sp. 6N223 TaxID=3457412 RepID=UPI003FCF1143